MGMDIKVGAGESMLSLASIKGEVRTEFMQMHLQRMVRYMSSGWRVVGFGEGAGCSAYYVEYDRGPAEATGKHTFICGWIGEDDLLYDGWLDIAHADEKYGERRKTAY